jgi:hypothetical protein
MDNERSGTAAPSETPAPPVTSPAGPDGSVVKRRVVGRRSFLQAGVGLGIATAALPTSALLAPTAAAASKRRKSGRLPKGDVAILRFLAALEILETDLWTQYTELGGVHPDLENGQPVEDFGGTGNPLYTAALQVLDGDMPQYIHDNTDDEISHFTFINAYLMDKGAQPVNLDKFRTLKGSQADGAVKDKLRLTNLMQLNVDTSWWERYRSDTKNPDFGDTFDDAVPLLSQTGAQFPAIPRDNTDTAGSTPANPTDLLQAIANTAGFHFGFIEQGGTSLYPSLAQRVNHPEVLRILLSIGPSETMHFQVWHDKAGNAPVLAHDVTINGLTLNFPDLAGSTDPLLKANLIMPEPTIFLDRKFPVCSIIRPTETEGAAAGAVKALTEDGLFIGQSPEFFDVLQDLAEQADKARR